MNEKIKEMRVEAFTIYFRAVGNRGAAEAQLEALKVYGPESQIPEWERMLKTLREVEDEALTTLLEVRSLSKDD